MKFFSFFPFFIVFLLSLQSCNQYADKDWNVKISNPVTQVQVIDISKELYNPNIPLKVFQEKFPWFQGSISDQDFELRRKDPDEIKIYKEALSKIDVPKLTTDLESLFSHIRYYFPQFQIPKVYLYSSALEGIMNPVIYRADKKLLFIDISAFMGENNPNYKGLEQYFQKSMNPKNLLPKVSEIFAEQFAPFDKDHQKFIDQLVYQGKIMILQDAFIPKEPDYLKINYTPEQYDWALANEANIWDYFVENNLIYSDDSRLSERFITPGPFSKFYTAVDNESSPQIGIFTGWQLCKDFFYQKPDTKLQDFLKMDANTIFKASLYKPKATE